MESDSETSMEVHLSKKCDTVNIISILNDIKTNVEKNNISDVLDFLKNKEDPMDRVNEMIKYTLLNISTESNEQLKAIHHQLQKPNVDVNISTLDTIHTKLNLILNEFDIVYQKLENTNYVNIKLQKQLSKISEQ